MSSLINLFIFMPFLGFLAILFMPPDREKLISITAFTTVGLHIIAFWIFFALWVWNGFPVLNLPEIELFRGEHYVFLVDFYFDKITAVYLFVGSLLTFLVATYSRYYLHREPGYKRFFYTILFFYLGYNVTIFAGNFETLFIGWELLGLSSFMLIAFYRERYLPVKNAVKVFSIYRLGDIGLILAMWASHYLWHENIAFYKLADGQLVHEHLEGHSMEGIFIAIMIFLAAAAKSAQLPFSSWLPRAMEGPTPSSAIFYGSLSVHIGVYLLLRTYPLWQEQIVARVLLGLMGLSTAVVGYFIARVQSSVKSQVAYASISQIGLIVLEVSLGFTTLALFHFAGNAFLRTYQLLVSPSVVSYMIREQFYHHTPRHHTIEDSLPKKIEYSIYLLSIKEFNLEEFMNTVLWTRLKRLGNKLNFLTMRNVFLYFVPVFLLGIAIWFFEKNVPKVIYAFLPVTYAFIGLVMVLKSFAERQNAFMAWTLVILNNLFVTLAILFNEHFNLIEAFYYLSGVIGAGIVGYAALLNLQHHEGTLQLRQFYGHAYEHPKTAMVFLLSCLGLMGFPISPTFIGVDLLFSHIHEHQIGLATFTAASFVITGISLIKMHSRLFLGPHVKTYHEGPFKSS